MMKSILHSFRPSTTMMAVRWKHSATQTKRLFNQHPARLRLLRKDQSKEEEVVAVAPALQYSPTVHAPRFLPNGWSAPPSPDTTTLPTYPFRVSRTQNKPQDAIGFLPVYTKHRKDGTKVTTRIKQVSGDRQVFLQELQALLPSQSIRVRTGGTIEVNGNYARAIRQWLAGLGF